MKKLNVDLLFFFVSILKLEGALIVNVTQVRMTDVEKDMSSWVSEGGCWKPSKCKARVKVRCCLFFV